MIQYELVDKLFVASRLRVLSGLFTNLTAGWIGAIFIFPNFSDLSTLANKLVLTYDVLAAIVCLLVAFLLEERSET